jgi:hypothetical protein
MIKLYQLLDLSKKGKPIPVIGREGPYGCDMLRLPHFL